MRRSAAIRGFQSRSRECRWITASVVLHLRRSLTHRHAPDWRGQRHRGQKVLIARLCPAVRRPWVRRLDHAGPGQGEVRPCGGQRRAHLEMTGHRRGRRATASAWRRIPSSLRHLARSTSPTVLQPDDALERHDVDPLDERRPAVEVLGVGLRCSGHRRVSGDEAVRHDATEAVEPPEGAGPCQHPALVWHERRVDTVVRRDAVGRDQQQVAVGDGVEASSLARPQADATPYRLLTWAQRILWLSCQVCRRSRSPPTSMSLSSPRFHTVR